MNTSNQFEQWDILQLNAPSAVDFALGTLYYNVSPNKGLFTKNHLNWWQDFPVNFNCVTGAAQTVREALNPCYFIVTDLVNSPTFQGYKLLLTSRLIQQHPELDEKLIEATASEEKRLMTLLQHRFKRKAKTDGIIAFLPFDAVSHFSCALPALGKRYENRYMIWQENYDSWFNWTVYLSLEQVNGCMDTSKRPEIRITCELGRDIHSYHERQGLRIRLAYGQYFEQNPNNIARINIHPRKPSYQRESAELNQVLNFDDPVIMIATDAARWTVSAQLDAQKRTISLQIRETIPVHALGLLQSHQRSN